MTSSIQSVIAQPVAAPDSMPMHQGVSPSLAIWSVRAISSSQVVRDFVAGGIKGSSWGTRPATCRWRGAQMPAMIGPSLPCIVPMSSQDWM